MKHDTALLRTVKASGFSKPEAVLMESVALFLFQKKLISFGKAAKLANMSLAQFMDLLGSMNIPQAEYSEDDFSMDMAALKKLKRCKT